MPTIVCCHRCFEQIAKEDTGAAKLWLDLCVHYTKAQGELRLREDRVPNWVRFFRSLEMLGFLTTVDGPDAVQIRVEGYDAISNEAGDCLDTYCIKREEHREGW